MAEVVQSREQLQHLARDGALRGHTYRDLHAAGLRVPSGDFAGATFERCTLGGADFGGANFSRVTLTRVDFRRVQMTEALVVRATCADSDLTELGLAGATLDGVEWQRVQGANLDLSRARLTSCHFVGCNLYGLRASQATILKSRWSDPTLNGAAELTRARLDGAVLIDCDFRGANLFRADFTGALVVRCHFGGASLTGAVVERARFVGCEFGGADLPDGLRVAARETES